MMIEGLRKRVLAVALQCYRQGQMVSIAGNFSGRDPRVGAHRHNAGELSLREHDPRGHSRTREDI